MIRSAQASVEATLDGFVTAVRAEIEGAEVEANSDDPTQWTPDSQAAIAEVANRFFTEYQTAHDECYPFIRGNFRVPEDLSHFLFRALDLSLVSPIHRASVALYTSQFATWESSAVISTDATEGHITSRELTPSLVANILVPLAETQTPFRWPLLVHELGHLLAPEGTRSDVLRKQVLTAEGEDPQSSLDDSLSELLADAIAERTMGPAFAIAMAREGYLLSFEKHSKVGGPTVKQRLNNLRFGQHIANALPPSWNLDGTRLDPETGENESIISEEDLEKVVRMTKILLEDDVPGTNPNHVSGARDLMNKDEPVPAVGFPEVPDHGAFEALARGEGTDLLNAVFRSVAEDPLTDAEILEAAWAEDVERKLSDFIRAITAPATQEERALVDHADVRLSRSLQAAAVHRWLLENDDKIQSNLAILESASAAEVPQAASTQPAAILDESSPLTDIQLARRLTLPLDNNDRLVVRPLIDPSQVGGTTIDLRLGTEWETLRTSRFRSLDPGDNEFIVQDLLNESAQEFRLTAGEEHGLVLHPGELLLALTLEYLRIPDNLWGQLEGRSTWARVGLQVHATAGMVDAGFSGYLTLELQNTGRLPIVLYPGLRVGQMAFFPVPHVGRPYRNKTGAAYSDQARARTAFTQQHEHTARYHFVHDELERESERKEKLSNQPKSDG